MVNNRREYVSIEMSTLQHFEDNGEGTDNFFKMSQHSCLENICVEESNPPPFQVPLKMSKLLIATACASTFYVFLAAEYQLR